MNESSHFVISTYIGKLRLLLEQVYQFVVLFLNFEK